MPLISVIIPVYNGEKTIKDSIRTVLSQSYADFELIVVDDGSIDSTIDIASNIRDPRIKTFSHPHGGPSKSRNFGFLKSSGEYISFLDVDDAWTSDKLQSQIETLLRDQACAVVYSWTDYMDTKGRFLYPGIHSSFTGFVYDKLLLYDFIESGSNLLIKKEALTEVGGFDESLSMAEDWDLALRLARHYSFAVVERVQVLYRISLKARSSDIAQLKKDCLKVIEQNFNTAPETLKCLKRASVINLRMYLVFRKIEAAFLICGGLRCLLPIWRMITRNKSMRRGIRAMAIQLFKIPVFNKCK